MSETRAPVLHCPYCAGEDLRPYEADDSRSAWVCRDCTRAFQVRFLGLQQQPVTARQEPGPGWPARPTEGAR